MDPKNELGRHPFAHDAEAERAAYEHIHGSPSAAKTPVDFRVGDDMEREREEYERRSTRA